MKDILVELSGHRGYNACEIENTGKAFKRAIDEGIDWIELDVKRTKDGVPVIFHDESLHRLLGVSKFLSKVTLEELKAFHYEDGQKVLTLDEFLDLTAGKIKLMIEIKSRGIERLLIDAIHQCSLENEVIIQSFQGPVLKRCHKIDPKLEYGLCLGPLGRVGSQENDTFFQKTIAKMAFAVLVSPWPVRYLNLDGPFIYDAFIDQCLAKGKKIILGARKTWKYLEKLDRWKVEIINADDPAMIKDLLDEKMEGKS